LRVAGVATVKPLVWRRLRTAKAGRIDWFRESESPLNACDLCGFRAFVATRT
jgi:hypothetical protein